VIHWRASRLLPQLPDDTLPRGTELEVRLHVASCARCRSRLHRIQLSEDLLRRIPPSIVPIETGPSAYARLSALSRWADDDEIPDPQGWRVSMLGAASAFLLLCIVATAGTWAPTVSRHAPPTVVLASLPLESAHLPSHYR
jgi:anti-sigma factor RsiW